MCGICGTRRQVHCTQPRPNSEVQEEDGARAQAQSEPRHFTPCRRKNSEAAWPPHGRGRQRQKQVGCICRKRGRLLHASQAAAATHAPQVTCRKHASAQGPRRCWTQTATQTQAQEKPQHGPFWPQAAQRARGEARQHLPICTHRWRQAAQQSPHQRRCVRNGLAATGHGCEQRRHRSKRKTHH